MATELQTGAHIIVQDGLRGTVENVTRDPITDRPQALVRFTDGQQALVPFSVLQWQPDGTYLLPVGLTDLSIPAGLHRRSDEEARITTETGTTAGVGMTGNTATGNDMPLAGTDNLTLGEFDLEDRAQGIGDAAPAQTSFAAKDSNSLSSFDSGIRETTQLQGEPDTTATGALESLRELAAGQEKVLPVVEEQLIVGKREIETGRVRVIKRVEERQETIDESLFRQEVQVERIPINRMVSEAEAGGVRTEGDTTIIPIYEEVLVVEKRLILKEELHVRTVRSEVREPQQVKLRRESIEVERSPV